MKKNGSELITRHDRINLVLVFSLFLVLFVPLGGCVLGLVAALLIARCGVAIADTTGCRRPRDRQEEAP